MKLKDVQNKIIELEEEFVRDHTGDSIVTSNVFTRDEILAKIRVLERKEQFLSSKRQYDLSLWLGIGSIFIGTVAVIASAIIAIYTKNKI